MFAVLNIQTLTQMTTAEFKQVATAKIGMINTDDLKAEIVKLTADDSDAAMHVWDVAMNVLMDRISPAEYIDFCNSL